MLLKTRLFRRVTIIGVGMMGGSLGLAIKKKKLAHEVVGLSYRQSSLVKAMKAGVIDVAFTDAGPAIRNSDLVIFATPVETIINLLPQIKSHLRKGCVVTDIGSTKVDIVETAQKVLPFPQYFVGSHPLAGSEKQGIDHAITDLFEGKKCVITPLDSTHKEAKHKVKLLWTSIGAEVKTMTPEEHDLALAYVSHLPHVIAYGLMGTIPENALPFSSTGLADTTRIASSTPQLWSEICLSNGKNIVKGIDEMVGSLSKIRHAILQKNKEHLIDFFQAAKTKRDSLSQLPSAGDVNES